MEKIDTSSWHKKWWWTTDKWAWWIVYHSWRYYNFSSICPPQIFFKLVQVVRKKFSHSFMVQQDVVIAVFLMEQCGLGSDCNFQPYLDIVPQQTVPWLDTFDDEDLLPLDDELLAKLVRQGWESLWNYYIDDNFQAILVIFFHLKCCWIEMRRWSSPGCCSWLWCHWRRGSWSSGVTAIFLW